MQDLKDSPLWPPALNALRQYMVDRHVSLIRWEQMREHPTQFVRYALAPQVVDYVRGIGALSDWDWELNTPQDPTFYAEDKPVLATDSTSGRIALFADEDDLAWLAHAGIRVVEPLGVKADPWPTP
jgi:hypothetical protein